MAAAHPNLPPCVVFEDEHLLVVNKPPGWNTHSPSTYAGQGVYDWFKAREPRWGKLAIVHRLDKETSGILVFSKTPQANRSLTQQFTEGSVRKEYVLQTARAPRQKKFIIRSHLKRVGDRYASQRGGVSGVDAETEFEVIGEKGGITTVLARPKTGRTHQIRVHASENGFPILGDALYGGAPFQRLCLHARKISIREGVFDVAENFAAPAWRVLREAIISIDDTDAFHWLNGAADGRKLHVDQLGPYILSQAPESLSGDDLEFLKREFPGKGIYHKRTTRHVRQTQPEDVSPQHTAGPKSDGPFVIQENGVRFELNFAEGYSTGLFLDQRDNRRRLLREARGEVLNTFAYTCGFSVCAALTGARTTSLDLSRKYLDWGRRNFQLNNLNPEQHDFIYGDVFDWLKRFAKKKRLFDYVLLDPPTFSQAKTSGAFRVERDFGRLVRLATEILRPQGVLFASSNSARWEPEVFLKEIETALGASGREAVDLQYVPQPPDFPVSREEPAYLKTVWIRIS